MRDITTKTKGFFTIIDLFDHRRMSQMRKKEQLGRCYAVITIEFDEEEVVDHKEGKSLFVNVRSIHVDLGTLGC